jgi:hypothetical protein
MTLRRAAAGILCAAGSILSAGAADASAATVHGANYIRSNGTYDCSAFQAITQLNTYVDTYRFGKGHTYKFGLMSPTSTKFHGPVSSGRYKVKGLKIVPTSGGLKKDGMYLLIQPSDLALVRNNGAFTGIGCHRRGAKSTTQPTTSTSPLIGTWECYDTVRQSSTAYQLFFKTEITFWSDATYLTSGGIRGEGWSQSGDNVQFTAGSLWSTFVHDAGTYSAAGVSMPNATGAATGPQWHLVLRDTQSNNETPPDDRVRAVGLSLELLLLQEEGGVGAGAGRRHCPAIAETAERSVPWDRHH